ncbi:MAG: hypothetical protein ABIH00_06850, partial [Armatimonadota bacterium]
EDGDLQLTAQLVSRFHTTDSLPEKISIIDVARSNRLYLLAGEFSYLLGKKELNKLDRTGSRLSREDIGSSLAVVKLAIEELKTTARLTQKSSTVETISDRISELIGGYNRYSPTRYTLADASSETETRIREGAEDLFYTAVEVSFELLDEYRNKECTPEVLRQYVDKVRQTYDNLLFEGITGTEDIPFKEHENSEKALKLTEYYIDIINKARSLNYSPDLLDGVAFVFLKLIKNISRGKKDAPLTFNPLVRLHMELDFFIGQQRKLYMDKQPVTCGRFLKEFFEHTKEINLFEIADSALQALFKDYCSKDLKNEKIRGLMDRFINELTSKAKEQDKPSLPGKHLDSGTQPAREVPGIDKSEYGIFMTMDELVESDAEAAGLLKDMINSALIRDAYKKVMAEISEELSPYKNILNPTPQELRIYFRRIKMLMDTYYRYEKEARASKDVLSNIEASKYGYASGVLEEYHKDAVAKVRKIGWPEELHKEFMIIFDRLLYSYLRSGRTSKAYTELQRIIKEQYEVYKNGGPVNCGTFILKFFDAMMLPGENLSFENMAATMIESMLADYYMDKTCIKNPEICENLEKLVDHVTKPRDIDIDDSPTTARRGEQQGTATAEKEQDTGTQALEDKLSHEFNQAGTTLEQMTVIEKARESGLYDLAADFYYEIGSREIDILETSPVSEEQNDYSLTLIGQVIEEIGKLLDDVKNRDAVESYMEELEDALRTYRSEAYAPFEGDDDLIDFYGDGEVSPEFYEEEELPDFLRKERLPEDPVEVSNGKEGPDLRNNPAEAFEYYREKEPTPGLVKEYARKANEYGLELLGSRGYARAGYRSEMEILQRFYKEVLFMARKLGYPRSVVNEIDMAFSGLLEIEKIRALKNRLAPRSSAYMDLSALISEQHRLYKMDKKQECSPSLVRYFDLMEIEDVFGVMDQAIMHLFKDYCLGKLADKKIHKVTGDFIEEIIGKKPNMLDGIRSDTNLPQIPPRDINIRELIKEAFKKEKDNAADDQAELYKNIRDRFYKAGSMLERISLADEAYKAEQIDLAVQLYEWVHDYAVKDMYGLDPVSKEWTDNVKLLGRVAVRILEIAREMPDNTVLNKFLNKLGEEPYYSFWIELSTKLGENIPVGSHVPTVVRLTILEVAKLAEERVIKRAYGKTADEIIMILKPYRNVGKPNINFIKAYFRKTRMLFKSHSRLIADKMEAREAEFSEAEIGKTESAYVLVVLREYYKDILTKIKRLDYPAELSKESLKTFSLLLKIYIEIGNTSQSYINLTLLVWQLYNSYKKGNEVSCGNCLNALFKSISKENVDKIGSVSGNIAVDFIEAVFVDYCADKEGMKNPQMRRNIEQLIDDITEPDDINIDEGRNPPFPPPPFDGDAPNGGFGPTFFNGGGPSLGGPPAGGSPINNKVGPFSLNKVMDKLNEAARFVAGSLGIIPRPVTVEGLSVPVMDAASRPVTPVNMAMSGNAAPPANPVPMS